MFLKSFALSAALSILACFIIDPIGDFYTSFASILVSGSISGVHMNETYHLALYPLAKGVSFLHRYFPNLPWLGVVILFCWVYIQSILVTLFFHLTGSPEFKIGKAIVVWIFLFFLVIGFSFIEFSVTGIGILLSAVSLYALCYLNTFITTRPARLAYTVILSLSFVSGYFWRVESGLGGTLIALIFISITELSIVRLLRIIWVPALFALLFFVKFYFVMNSHPFFRDVEPLVYYVTDSRNPPPIKPIDSADEIKLKMARASFLIDSTIFNYDLFNRMAKDKLAYEETLPANPSRFFKQIKIVAEPTLCSNKTLISIYFLLLLMPMAILLKQKEKKAFLQLAGFNVAIWCVICISAYSVKMETWHFVPIIQTTIIGNLIFLIRNSPHLFSGKTNYVFLLVFGLCVISAIYLHREINLNRKMINEKTKLADRIFKTGKNKLIFFDVNTREVLDNYIFRKPKPHNNIVLYDLAQIPFLPEFQKNLNDLCQCNSHSALEFFNYLKTQSGRIEYCSSPYRVAFIEELMESEFKMNVQFVPQQIFILSNNRFGIDSAINYKIIFNPSATETNDERNP